MRRLRWIGGLVILLLLACAGLDRLLVLPRQVGGDNIQGMSKEELRARYGEPTIIVRDNFWIYERGWLGGGTGIQFDGDVVVHYESRDAR